jgi:hypothetical protein
MFTTETHTIVGVVGHVRQAGLDVPRLPEIYIPYGELDSGRIASEMVLVVKTSGPPASLVPAVRAAVRGVDAGQPLFADLRGRRPRARHRRAGRHLRPGPPRGVCGPADHDASRVRGSRLTAHG